uniref:Uncharacterized protein n=1 Tax=Timema shepardi TaxID=629360 RepID=A0A7R9AXE1_TIMSH|nr:unnamed protein product [Timema shepardi]
MRRSVRADNSVVVSKVCLAQRVTRDDRHAQIRARRQQCCGIKGRLNGARFELYPDCVRVFQNYALSFPLLPVLLPAL